MARIAHRFIVQIAYRAFQCFAQGTDAARGGKGFIVDAVEGKAFQPFQRQYFAPGAFVDNLARIAIFIDQALGAPGQVVAERVVRKLGERADL